MAPAQPAVVNASLVERWESAEDISFQRNRAEIQAKCTSKIARLAAMWIAEGWCRETIFNLKLPMKKRWEEVERCRAILDEGLGGGGYSR